MLYILKKGYEICIENKLNLYRNGRKTLAGNHLLYTGHVRLEKLG
jgi:hypothetical protein